MWKVSFVSHWIAAASVSRFSHLIRCRCLRFLLGPRNDCKVFISASKSLRQIEKVTPATAIQLILGDFGMREWADVSLKKQTCTSRLLLTSALTSLTMTWIGTQDRTVTAGGAGRRTPITTRTF